MRRLHSHKVARAPHLPETCSCLCELAPPHEQLAGTPAKFACRFIIKIERANELNLRGHYISSYKNDRTGITSTNVGSWNSLDLQYSRTLEGLGGGTTLTFGAINMFDKSPPVAQLNLGFDPIVHDPRGRVLYVGVNQKF